MTIQHNPLRASVEARAILVAAGAKNLKGRALKAAMTEIERLHCIGDRLAQTTHDAFRSHQLALALVDAAIKPKANPQLSCMVALKAQALAA